MATHDPLLTAKNVADILGVSIRSLYRRQHDRDFPPPVRVGRCVRFRSEDVEAYIQKHRRARQPNARS